MHGIEVGEQCVKPEHTLIVGQGPLNEDAVEEIESLLLQADVGVAATDKIIAGLQAKLRQEVLPPDQAIAFLKQRPDVLARQTAEHERHVLETIVREARAVDGVTRRHEATVDGLPFLTYIQPWLGIRRLLGLEP